jgi:putative DNA primase/helicase
MARKPADPSSALKAAASKTTEVHPTFAPNPKVRAALSKAQSVKLTVDRKTILLGSSTPDLGNKSVGGSGGKHTPEQIAKLKECAQLDPNDRGNGQRLLIWHGDRVLYVAQGPGWHVWKGTHWHTDLGDLDARELALTIVDRIKEEAASIELSSDQKATVEAAAELRKKEESKLSAEEQAIVRRADDALKKLSEVKSKRKAFAITSGNAARTASMLSQAAALAHVQPDQLDRDLLKLNVKNGTLRFWREDDLECPDPDISRKIGRVELLPHDRLDLITRLADVEYDPSAVAPEWQGFLDRVQPSPEIQRFLKVAHGYAGLLGGNDEQRMIYHFGRGANGKSAFVETIGRALGTYRAVTSPESFSGNGQRQGNQQNSDMARLFNTRLVTVEELPRGEPLKEYLIKQFTGGSRLVARFLNREWFEFDPTFTAVMAGNDMPTISGMDHGIWRRLLIVPWRVEIPEADRMPFGELLAIFDKERSGILNWLVEGALLWIAEGLASHIPAEIRDFTEKHREDRDILGNFIDAYVVREPGSKVQAKAMLDAFSAYCEGNGIKPWHQATVGNALKAMGFEKEQGRHVHYVGLRLVDPPSRFDPAPPHTYGRGD